MLFKNKNNLVSYIYFLCKNSISNLHPQNPYISFTQLYLMWAWFASQLHSLVIYFMVMPINLKWTLFTTMWKGWDVVTAVVNYYMNKESLALCSPYCFVKICHCILMGEHRGMNIKGKLFTLAMPFQRNLICFIIITIYTVHLNVKYIRIINYNHKWIDISVFPSITNRRWENNIF